MDSQPSPDDGRTSRRNVLDWLLAGSLGALVVAMGYPVALFLTPPHRKQSETSEVEAGLANDPEYLEKGYRIIQFGGQPVLVVRSGEDFRAFSAVCTHLGCIVEYRKAQKDIYCNCHGGEYNLQGQVTGGPPPRPLQSYAVKLAKADSGPAKVIVARS